MDLLPDPILEMILNKTSDDAKELFFCSSVSKRFANLILRPRNTLSLQVPKEGVNKFLESFKHFIKQFGCIGTLYLKSPLSLPKYAGYFADPFVKWEFTFKYPKSVRHGLVLSAKSFTAIDGGEEEKVEEQEEDSGGHDLFMFEERIHACLSNLRKKWDVLGVPMDVRVDKVVVMDSQDQGMMVVDRLDGPVFAPNKSPKYMLSYNKSYTLSWYVPVLRLPESRCVLKGVSLCYIQTGNEGKLVFPGCGNEMKVENAAEKIMPTGGVLGKDMDFLREAARKIMEKPASSYLVRHHV